jgi:hypothetical protein
MIRAFIAAAVLSVSGTQALSQPLSKEAEVALDQAARDYREDPLLGQLRRAAYDPANIRAARDVLDRHLFDYRSSRIRDVSAYFVFEKNRRSNKDGSVNPPMLIYCGMVNAPNRLGGLVGWRSRGWSPAGIPGPATCPSEFGSTGLIRVKVERVGPVGDDNLTHAFDPNVSPAPASSGDVSSGFS